MFKNIQEIKDKDNIELKHKVLTKDISKTFLTILMMEPRELKELCHKLIESQNPSIFLLVHKRYSFYKMEDKIDLEALLLIDLFAEGVPGRAVFILIEMLNLYEDVNKKVTLSDMISHYPFGFYTDETFQYITDNYIKTGLLRNSDIY